MKLSEENQKKLEALTQKYEGKISAAEIHASAMGYFQEHATLSGFDIEKLIDNKEETKNKDKATDNKKDDKEDSLYIQEDDKNKGNGSGFKLNFDGKPRAVNEATGDMFEAEDPYTLFNKLNDVMVKNEAKSGTLKLSEKNKNREDIKEGCARSAIEHGMKMFGDIPQNPEFWQSFKAEYLKDKKHSAEKWEELTAHIPDEIIGRNKISDKEKLNMLSRQGINPNLETPKKQNTVQTKLNVSQISKQAGERQ